MSTFIATARGARANRSWGIRGVGERAPGVPAEMAPQFYWLWAPVNFDDVCTHFDVNEHGDGQQWHRSGYVIPVLGDAATDPVLDTGGLAVSAEPMSSVQCTIDWEPGTRRATHARIEMSPWNVSPLTVDLEPIVTFQMMGDRPLPSRVVARRVQGRSRGRG